jgi:predicted metal-dependent HD superfamily phosphohydrolase
VFVTCNVVDVMIIHFCLDPSKPRQPDEAYRVEAATAERLGLPVALVDHDALVHENDPAKAVRRVSEQPSSRIGLYRGWMMTPDQYQRFFDALEGKGVRLLNDPAAYRHCHYLPESYPAIESHTPRSVWIKTRGDVSMDEIMAILRLFGSAPVVVKDFVKSRKHEWAEACFIPSAADRATVERVVRRFLELQGDDLSEGLVFREFVEFEPLGRHPKSGMPLTKEFRLFFLDGHLIFWTPYWDEDDYAGLTPPVERFAAVAGGVRSRFFTMDVAQRGAGDWLIVELGDAQVAGLPDHADVDRFFESIRDHWPDEYQLMNDLLRRKWHDLLGAWAVTPSLTDEMFEDLRWHYAGTGRFYHTLVHIGAVLEIVENLNSFARNLKAVKLAVWLHDVIYDSRASDNEERSAEYAAQLCEKLSIPQGREVASLILKTKTHDAGEDVDAQVLLDADLAILGANEPAYPTYADQIRQEYAWASEPDYRMGRRHVLERFLTRPRIFHLLAHLEEPARRNISAEIARLAGV